MRITLAATAMLAALAAPLPAAAQSEPFIGQIMCAGFNFTPRGWARLDGQLLPIAQNQALFSLLGTTYGGDGRTTFALPDMRGRALVHDGNGPGLTPRTLGERGGAETHTLTPSQMPAHTHTVAPRASTAALRRPARPAVCRRRGRACRCTARRPATPTWPRPPPVPPAAISRCRRCRPTSPSAASWRCRASTRRGSEAARPASLHPRPAQFQRVVGPLHQVHVRRHRPVELAAVQRHVG